MLVIFLKQGRSIMSCRYILILEFLCSDVPDSICTLILLFINVVGKVDIDGALHIIKVTSVVLFLVSIGCTYTGIMTLKYSAPYWQFPFVTGSGVWTGISVCRYIFILIDIDSVNVTNQELTNKFSDSTFKTPCTVFYESSVG